MVADDLILMTSEGVSDFTENVFTVADDFVVFSVKASGNALVALSHIPGGISSNTYKITYGDTTVIERADIDVKQTFPTPGLLNENEYTDLWITWAMNALYIGNGTIVGESEIGIFMDEEMFEIHSASFTTGEGVQGMWRMALHAGR